MEYIDHNGSLGWPPEMLIRVSAHPRDLLELLWIRHVLAEPIRPDLPAADLPASQTRSSVGAISADWDDLWSVGLDEARKDAVPIPATARRVTRRPSVARVQALAARLMVAPDEPVASWEQELHNNISAEFAVAPELLIAWRAGLRFVIDLPLVGEYWARIGEDTLLVGTAVRSDPFAYLRALSGFAQYH